MSAAPNVIAVGVPARTLRYQSAAGPHPDMTIASPDPRSQLSTSTTVS